MIEPAERSHTATAHLFHTATAHLVKLTRATPASEDSGEVEAARYPAVLLDTKDHEHGHARQTHPAPGIRSSPSR